MVSDIQVGITRKLLLCWDHEKINYWSWENKKIFSFFFL